MTNLAQLWIFYEELRYTSIEQQEAYTWLALLSDIGGALGLVLGSCLLTVAQIFDVTLAVLCQKWAMNRQLKRQTTTTTTAGIGFGKNLRFTERFCP